MSSTFSIGVFAVILDERKRVLLCHRTDYDLWNMPGGQLEYGETPQGGLIREVREETGLTVEVRRLSGVYSNPARGDLVLAFVCSAVGGTLAANDETDRFAWLDNGALPANTAPRHVDRIRDALAERRDAALRVQSGPPSNVLLGLASTSVARIAPAPTFRIGAFAVVRDALGRVLLGHRRDCDFWGLPGGGMETGETPWEATMREAREETGLAVAIERLVGVYSWPDSGEHIFSFAAGVAGGSLATSDETRDVRFFAPDALPRNTFAEHAERIRDTLAAHPAPLLAVPHVPSATQELRE